MNAVAIVVAAGRGERAGPGAPKQFRLLAGKPVLRWSLEAFARDPRFGAVIVVGDPARAEETAAACAGLPVRLVAGGATRDRSVVAGLAAAEQVAPQFVFIHDAARPGLSAAVIDRLFAALEEADGAAPALPVADALKRADAGLVSGAVARDGLMQVQTPQCFRFQAIQAAFAALPPEAAPVDDIEVATQAGLRVRLVVGNPHLLKLTRPEDFAVAERLLAPALSPRVGFGADAHRFGPGDHVTLCGVKIDHAAGLIGHSDADAAWHALSDALYGALGEGDIGAHFPPSQPRWKGAGSDTFLAHAAERVRARGGVIAHVDLTIICERPKIGPHREAMRERTAAVLAVPVGRVGVKATTMEGMGFTGREEGLAAQAVATVLLPAGDGDVS